MKNYYEILTVERSDSSATIKRVFRRRALQLHPDINKVPNAHQQFIDLNEAYQVLRNPLERKRYNKLIDARIKKTNSAKATRKRKKWESHITSSAKKGKARGERYASESANRFKKRTDSWASRLYIDLFLELTFRVLGVVIDGILDA